MGTAEKIREKRSALGLTDAEVAAQAGMSVDAYDDIEGYDDEFTNVITVADAKRVANVLGLDLLELLDLTCSSCGTPGVKESMQPLKSNELARKRREELSIPRHELATRLGWDESLVDNMEEDPSFFEETTIDTVMGLAEALRLPADLLLSIECFRCRGLG